MVRSRMHMTGPLGARAGGHCRAVRGLAGRALTVLLAGLVLGGPLVASGGCALLRTRPKRDLSYATPYPSHLRQRQTLDIQVIRDGTTISLTNTTARSFGPSRVWLNAWYSRPIDGLEVGQTLKLDLYSFRDEFGDAFRGGGFFATQDPDAVVQAQLETGALADGQEAGGSGGRRRLLGLVVVEGESDEL